MCYVDTFSRKGIVCIFKSTFFQYISGHQVQNPFHPAVTLQNIYPKGRVIQSRRDLCLRILITGLFFFFFFFFFPGPHPGHTEVPRPRVKGSNQSFSYWLMPQPQQCRTQAMSVTYTTAHGNIRSPSHGARPGMEPTLSWILVGFVSAVSQ